MTFVLVIRRPRDLCVVVTGVSENNVISQVKNSFTNKVYHDIMIIHLLSVRKCYELL